MDKKIHKIPRPLSIAPMLDWTDRHFRYFIRLITRHTFLYTEMITSQALLHGDRHILLDYSAIEQPIGAQLAGNDAKDLAECAKIIQDWGYAEVNLNVGCPSDRVQHGRFGVCLMAFPDKVAHLVEKMKKAVDIPVTVKHRLGIDQFEEYEHLMQFVRTLADAGCDRFIVHARFARMKGTSPKENRSVPPLQYGQVYRLKADFPGQLFDINGGIQNYSHILAHLDKVDGVMLGRAAYQNPYLLHQADHLVFSKPQAVLTRRQIIEKMVEYIHALHEQGINTRPILRHLFGLYRNQPGARAWRRFLTESHSDPVQVLKESLRIVDETASDS